MSKTEDARHPDLVVVGVPTCNRPTQLARLLASFHALEPPKDTRLIFVIVDNGTPSQATDALVDDFRGKCPWPVELVAEPTRGIPYARNTLLETALASGARYLVGLDDDELATPTWVADLVKVLQTGMHPLVGGPIVRQADPTITLTAREAWFLAALVENAEVDAADRIEFAITRPEKAWVYTNNYGLDLDAVRRSGIRYDVAFALSGGEDTDFANRLRDLAGPLGWAPDAHVIEVLPRVRLQAGYHIARQRDLGIMMAKMRGWSRARAAWGFVVELGEVIYGGVAAIFGTKESKLLTLFRIGRAQGYFLAACGRDSRHYRPDAEHLR